MKPIEQTAAFRGMTAANIPPARAEQKLHSTRRGWLFVIAGALCILGAFAFVIWTMIVTKGAPSAGLLIFAALLGLPGAYFLLAGGHLISGDAMLAAEQSGGVIARTAARALRLAQPKGGP